MNFLGLIFFACFCCASLVASKSFSRIGNAVSIRGGRKSKVVKENASNPRKRSRFDEEDDGDEDGDTDAEEEQTKSFRSSRPKRGASRHHPQKSRIVSKSKTGKKSQLVTWGEKSMSDGSSIVSGLAGWKAKIEDLAKKGQTAYKDVYRRAKVMKSSAFEGILLRATWPDDKAVPQDLLAQIIKQSIPAFRHSSLAEDDPYHMTMHKLWTKMCEKDWRTVSKSLFVLHCISRDSSVNACERFASAIRTMERVRNPKKPDHRYFDVKRMGVLDAPSSPYKPFVQSYAKYVFYRAKTFSNRFNELKDVSSSTSEKKAVERLKKAMECITLGLQCFPASKSQYSLITGHAIRHVAVDLRELWSIFSEKMVPLLEEGGYKGAKATEKDIAALLKFFLEKEVEVSAYLKKASKAFASLRIKIPSELEGAANAEIASGKVASRLETLTKISGGARRKTPVPPPVEDDDDEEDDDEEEIDEEDVDEEDDDNEDEDEDEEASIEKDDDDDEEEDEDEKDDDDEEEDDLAASNDDKDSDDDDDSEDDVDDFVVDDFDDDDEEQEDDDVDDFIVDDFDD